jgi:hypothetical protein
MIRFGLTHLPILSIAALLCACAAQPVALDVLA